MPSPSGSATGGHRISRLGRSAVAPFRPCRGLDGTMPCKGRTVDNVIAVMEAEHPHLTTQQSFYVEISRARHNATLGNARVLRKILETATGERAAALEGIDSAAMVRTEEKSAVRERVPESVPLVRPAQKDRDDGPETTPALRQEIRGDGTRHVVGAAPGHPSSRINEPLPWNFKPPSS